MSRLIIISNRLPFSIERSGEELCIRQSSGGLVSAIKSFFEKEKESAYTDKIWVGSVENGKEEWQRALEEGILPDGFGMEAVFPDESIYSNFYNGFSNSTLWPLFHYFPLFAEFRKEYFDDYRKVNELFADKVEEIYEEGDVIWVHDYQLMLVPDMLRKRLPDATIGFFLHIPFPSYEILRLLPTEWKKQLMQGLMGADMIGFHTQDYVQHFIQSAKMILKVESQFNSIYYGNRMVRADQFPIGIDYARFREACVDDMVVGICTALEEKFMGQQVIFSVDRLDYTKGLEYRLDGFALFLDQHPEYREKVVFILNIIPSRDSIPSYNDMKRRIDEQVSTINGNYSTLQWQPIIYRYNHLAFEDLAPFIRRRMWPSSRLCAMA